MGDLISREDTLTAFADYVGSGMSMNDYEALWDIVAKMPSVKQEPKWIPVSERLPEFRKEVLTCTDGGFIEIQSLEESYGGYWENQKGDWSDFDEIIAWMPLPTPYEPQERSDKA